MTDAVDADCLLALVKAALAAADRQRETLVAALLAQCLDALEQRGTPDPV